MKPSPALMAQVNEVGQHMAEAHRKHGKGSPKAMLASIELGLRAIAQDELDTLNGAGTCEEKVAAQKAKAEWSLSTGIALLLHGASTGDITPLA